jgi:cytochrome o ubiquinol oxidase subunit 2
MGTTKTRGWVSAGLLLALAFAMGGCAQEGLSFLTPGGPVAAAERAHLLQVALISMVVVLPVLIGAPLIAWRYRRRSRAPYAPDWEYSRPLEMAMWGVPAVVVVVLGWQLAHATLALDPYRRIDPAAAPLRVDAIGLDWKWLFVYPDLGLASLNEMAFAAGRPVVIRLTSDTVMQSFFIGALGSQIYAMPGMETRLNLLADRPGRFEGENTQFNGLGFQHQKFAARAMTTREFDAWVAGVRAAGRPLDGAAYAVLGHASTPAQAASALAGPFVPPGVAWFSQADSGLFDAVLHRYMSGRPVPADAQPGSPRYSGTLTPPAPPAGAGRAGGMPHGRSPEAAGTTAPARGGR